MGQVSGRVKSSGQGRLTVSDAVGTSLVIPFTRGDFTLGPLPADGVLNEVVQHDARGQRVSESYGARIYPAGGFSVWLTSIIGGDAVPPGAFAEFVAKQNAYATLVPTSGDAPHAPKTWNLLWEILGQKVSVTEVIESVSMKDVSFTANLAESDEGASIAWSYIVRGSPIRVVNGSSVLEYRQMDTA